MPPFLTEGGWGVESAPQSLQIIHRPLYPTRRFLHNPTGANDLSLGRPSLCRPYGIQKPPFCPDPSTGRQVSRADWGTGHLSRAPPLPRPTRLGHRFHFVIDAGDPPPPSNPPLPSRPDGGPIGGQVICGEGHLRRSPHRQETRTIRRPCGRLGGTGHLWRSFTTRREQMTCPLVARDGPAGVPCRLGDTCRLGDRSFVAQAGPIEGRADRGTGHLSRVPPLPRPTRLGHRFHFVIDAGDPPPPSNPPLPSRPDAGPIGGQVICGVAGGSGIESNNLNLKRPSPSASALS